jgi:hypothetical protein
VKLPPKFPVPPALDVHALVEAQADEIQRLVHVFGGSSTVTVESCFYSLVNATACTTASDGEGDCPCRARASCCFCKR